MTAEKGAKRWIVIPRWEGPDGFQHYRDRDPVWIKNYRYLLASDEYRDLTLAERGLLHGLWLEYARSAQELPGDTLRISRRLGQRVSNGQLKRLSDAGFITFSASKPLAKRYHEAMPEKEEEKETPLPPTGNKPKPRRAKRVEDMTHEEKNPHVCGICPAREATEVLITEHRENVHGVTVNLNGHAGELAAVQANGHEIDLLERQALEAFFDTEPDPQEDT